MDRQDCRRQRTGLYFQGRYERQFDSNRTAPKSCNIIDECNLLLLFHRRASPYTALTGRGQLLEKNPGTHGSNRIEKTFHEKSR